MFEKIFINDKHELCYCISINEKENSIYGFSIFTGTFITSDLNKITKSEELKEFEYLVIHWFVHSIKSKSIKWYPLIEIQRYIHLLEHENIISDDLYTDSLKRFLQKYIIFYNTVVQEYEEKEERILIINFTKEYLTTIKTLIQICKDRNIVIGDIKKKRRF